MSSDKGFSWSDVSGTNISGATSATLSITPTNPAESGNEYRAALSNANGSSPTYSNPAELTVMFGTKVTTWGWNLYGQLGNGTFNGGSCGCSEVPVTTSLSPPAGVTVVQVAGGFGHSLALLSNGSVMAWGSNAYGQLGDASTLNSDVPVTVSLIPPGATVTAIAAGAYDSFALLSNGTVMAWGNNTYGGLGDGSTTGSKCARRR